MAVCHRKTWINLSSGLRIHGLKSVRAIFIYGGLAAKVKEGIRAAGGTPLEFNTVSISDGITMGTEGMKTSLISREVIADSIELVSLGNMFDAVVALCGCDKTVPGTVMALARLDIPALTLYGGSIMPGHFQGRDVTIQDVFEAVGQHAEGTITVEELDELISKGCPGPGACGGQFTANTMATAVEMLGIAPMGSGSVPAVAAEKDRVAYEAGQLIMDMLAADRRPNQIITRKSLENAITSIAATGGSTNGVLHLLAIAHEAQIPITLEDFHTISQKNACAGRSETGRAVCRHGSVSRRRHSAACETFGRGRAAPHRRTHRYRRDYRRRSESGH